MSKDTPPNPPDVLAMATSDLHRQMAERQKPTERGETPTPRTGTCPHDGKFFDADTLTCVKCELAAAKAQLAKAEEKRRDDIRRCEDWAYNKGILASATIRAAFPEVFP